MLVVILAMSAYHGFGSSLLYGAVTADDIVVANAFPTSLLVPLVNLGCAGALVGTDGGAVDYEECYCSHGGSGGFTVNVFKFMDLAR